MDLISSGLLAACIVVFSIYLMKTKNKVLNKIPGPKGYPLIGNVLQMDFTNTHETLSKWARQYSDIMKISLFGEDIVVVNSLEGITEVLVTKSKEFAGRPKSYRIAECNRHEALNLTDISKKYSLIKKVAINGLKQSGKQLTELEVILQTYLENLVGNFQKLGETPVDLIEEINKFVYEITFSLVYGRELGTEEFQMLKNSIDDMNYFMDPTSKYAILDTFKILRGPWFKPYRLFQEKMNLLNEFFGKTAAVTVEQHSEGMKCGMTPLIEEMKNPTVTDITPVDFGNIYTAALHVVTAGVVTTNSALYYFLSLMAANPDIQQEAYEHIIEAIGHRSPCLEDRAKIPYMESMMYEMLRLMSHVPVAIPHKAMEDTTLLGYEIPKDTQVWVNLWHLHHDEKLWSDPWKFKPTRFLDENGEFVKADHPLRKQFLAFGAGRRVCAGETFAKHRLFMTMVTLLQKFQFRQPDGESINTDPKDFKLLFVLRPKYFKIKITSRQ